MPLWTRLSRYFKALTGAAALACALLPGMARADTIRLADMLRGITVTQAQCAAIHQTVWVQAMEQDFCIRYSPSYLCPLRLLRGLEGLHEWLQLTDLPDAFVVTLQNVRRDEYLLIPMWYVRDMPNEPSYEQFKIKLAETPRISCVLLDGYRKFDSSLQ